MFDLFCRSEEGVEVYAQGDVALVKVERLPKKASFVGNELEIRGENGRHGHLLRGVEAYRGPASKGELPKMLVAERPRIDWNWVVVPEEGTVLEHVTHDRQPAEHPLLPVLAGTYVVVQAREYESRGSSRTGD